MCILFRNIIERLEKENVEIKNMEVENSSKAK